MPLAVGAYVEPDHHDTGGTGLSRQRPAATAQDRCPYGSTSAAVVFVLMEAAPRGTAAWKWTSP